MMDSYIQAGPSDNKKIPYQSLGILFYNEIKKKNPSEVILIESATGEEITYEKLLKLSVNLASNLRKLGVKRGDVITIVSQNNWKYILTILASFYIGAAVNLLNHDYTSGELQHLLSLSQPRLIFCSRKAVENVLKLKEYNENIIIYDEEISDQVRNVDVLLKDCEKYDFSPVELNPKEDVALILTSSGTTGLPKCVLLTHANIRTVMLYAGDVNFFDINDTESIIGYLPFFHIFGNMLALAGILFGCKVVILEKFIPDRFLKIIHNHKITKLFTVPPILLFLVKTPLINDYDISSIKDIICGAAVVSKELEKMAVKRLNIKSVRQVYGMTESGAVTILPKNIEKYGTVGKPTTTHQIKVCDIETGKALTANEIGEVRIKGGGVMKGYLGNEKETKDAFDEDGFMKSGDLGYYDDEGFFYIVDRLKEIIKYKGFQVSPAELEYLLIQHPAVRDAGVIGIPDERAGEVPLAFVVKQPDKKVTEEELIRYIDENVSVQKRLYGGVKFVEEIPKSATGKILRKKLKELLQVI